MKKNEIQHMITKSVVSNAEYLRQSGVPDGKVSLSLELPDGSILFESFSIRSLTSDLTMV